MKKTLIIPLFGLLFSLPCQAGQKFIWLTDSTSRQGTSF